MSFWGFSLPDGAYLPPELIYLMPNISGSKLKAVIAILYHNLQVGGGEPLSLTDIEKYTGLSKRQVIRALAELLDDGVIERQMVGQSYVYIPSLRTTDKMSLPTDKMSPVSLRESERKLNINNINYSLSDSLTVTDDKMSLVRKLRAAGVYLKTAQGMVNEHDNAYIDRHLAFYRYALTKNLAQGPGWLVSSLKEDWPEPLGYRAEAPKGHPEGCGCTECAQHRAKYAEWET